MIKPEWGVKRTCPRCSTRFYDLGAAEPVTCINCGHTWLPEPVLKSKQALPFEEVKPKEPVAAEAESDEALDLPEEDADASADDTDVDIGGEDDLSEVVVQEGEEDR